MSSRPVELFGLATAEKLSGRLQIFEQRNDIDAAAFQHRAVAFEVDLVGFHIAELIGDVCALCPAGSSRGPDKRAVRAANRGSPAASVLRSNRRPGARIIRRLQQRTSIFSRPRQAEIAIRRKGRDAALSIFKSEHRRRFPWTSGLCDSTRRPHPARGRHVKVPGCRQTIGERAISP